MEIEHFRFKDDNYVIKLRQENHHIHISTHYKNGGFATGIERTIHNVMGISLEEMIIPCAVYNPK